MTRWCHEFVKLAVNNVDNSELLVELMGVFANLSDPDSVPWGQLCGEGLLDLLHRLLVVGFSEDDLVLLCVMIIGNIALDAEGSQILAVQHSKLLVVLQELLALKHEDDDIVLQLLYSFYCMVIQQHSLDLAQLIISGPSNAYGDDFDSGSFRLTSYIMDMMRLGPKCCQWKSSKLIFKKLYIFYL